MLLATWVHAMLSAKFDLVRHVEASEMSMQVPSSGKSPLVHSDYRPSKPRWALEPNVDYEQDEKEIPTEVERESCALGRAGVAGRLGVSNTPSSPHSVSGSRIPFAEPAHRWW